MNKHTFLRAYPPQLPSHGPAMCFVFRGHDLLVMLQSERGCIPLAQDLPPHLQPVDALFLGTVEGVDCIAAEIGDDVEVPETLTFIGLRSLFGEVSEQEFMLAGYASQILYWKKTSKFCPVCGHLTEAGNRDWGRHCPQCGHTGYPRVSPAVLILVYDDDGRILLASKPGWGDRHSILAGFVEPGETLEECVARETLEEVSLTVSDFAYDGSQSWPFPHQLMVGFTCRYVAGDIRLDEDELNHAAWYTPDDLPPLPPSVSLSRQMIDRWLTGQANMQS